jgi:hypothetical protein
MIKDFTKFFWPIGRAILEGRDPYSITGNVYPPTACLFFFLFWLSSFLEKDKWYALVAAALLTLKPQIALVVLPAVLVVD